jgi:hypothetical protein
VIAANPQFSAMVQGLKLVPTLSLQLWSTRAEESLCGDSAAAMVSGPPPLDIWANMSQLLDDIDVVAVSRQAPAESTGPGAARSLHFLCGVLVSDLYRACAQEVSIPSTAKKLARERAIEWLNKHFASIWPKAKDEHGAFDWSALYCPEKKPADEGRIDCQYFAANVDPSACCVASASGTSWLRLAPHESGISQLYLAGAWTHTGFNNECVESAVMSGMQAARAICGSPQSVPGEDFLRVRTWGFDLCGIVKAVAGAAWTAVFANDPPGSGAAPAERGGRAAAAASSQALRGPR